MFGLDLGPVLQRRVEDAAALAAGTGHHQDVDALVDVAGHGGRALARLVVRMGMNRHQSQRGRVAHALPLSPILAVEVSPHPGHDVTFVVRAFLVSPPVFLAVGATVSSTDHDTANVTWLTQEAHDRLAKELDELVADRPAMAKEINDRREEGDLKENGGYHAAREEQGKQEARIAHLHACCCARRRSARPPPATASPARAWSSRCASATTSDERDVPDRLARRGRDREHRRLLGRVPARQGADRRQGGRDRLLPDAQRQDAASDLGQGGSVQPGDQGVVLIHALREARLDRPGRLRPSAWAA